jgi:hypothetical protein
MIMPTGARVTEWQELVSCLVKMLPNGLGFEFFEQFPGLDVAFFAGLLKLF